MNDGGPAFPIPGSPGYPGQVGMSLRDWFAGQILVHSASSHSNVYADEAAERAYIFADAMLVERAKERP